MYDVFFGGEERTPPRVELGFRVAILPAGKGRLLQSRDKPDRAMASP